MAMIRGSARLPACVETPAFDLDGTFRVDSGMLTVTTAGCDLEVGTPVRVCGLRWDFSLGLSSCARRAPHVTPLPFLRRAEAV